VQCNCHCRKSALLCDGTRGQEVHSSENGTRFAVFGREVEQAQVEKACDCRTEERRLLKKLGLLEYGSYCNGLYKK
jgi:hypothetical protein